MKKLLIVLFFIIGCKGGTHQEIIIKNSSKQNVFYCIHNDSLLTALDVRNIRPWDDERIKEHHQNLIFDNKEDSLKNAGELKTAFLIETGTDEMIFSSRGLKIFNDKESIQQQIKYEYKGKLFVSLINEDDLKLFSDSLIAKKKLYKHFLSLQEKDITKNTMVFEYK